MDLNDVYLFVKLLEYGSFTKAAESLRLQKSLVSRRIANLEKALEVKLLNRTTRSLSLTEEGRAFYERTHSLMDGLNDAKMAVQSLNSAPQGRLRITTAIALGQFVSFEIIPGFLKKYPDIQIDLHISTIKKDIVKERFDLALRPGKIQNSNLICKQVGLGKFSIVANNDFAKKIKQMKHPKELESLPWVTNMSLHAKDVKLKNGEEECQLLIKNPRLGANNLLIIRNAIINGVGIGLLPNFMFQSDFKNGPLNKVMTDWQAGDVPLYAIYPSREFLSSKTRAFLEYLEEKKYVFD